MKTSDIILHLEKYLPRVTNKFSEVIKPSSITILEPNVAQFNFSQAHNLEEDEHITITNTKINTEIQTLSIDPITQIVTATTFTNHDLTEKQIKEVTISSEGDLDLNGNFTLLSVPNRKTFTFKFTKNTIDEPGLTYLEEMKTNGNINTVFSIFNVTQNSFQIETPFNFPNVSVNTIDIHLSVRISGGGDIDSILKHYEQMIELDNPVKDLWGFVVLDDVTTSKDRQVNNDATSNQGNLNDWNVQILRPFSLFVIVPSETDITARRARDTCEDLRASIYSVLLGMKFQSGFSTNGGSAVSSLGDELAGYFGSYYVHRFRFEQVDQVCNDDILYLGEDSAYRDVDLDMLDVFNNSNDVKLISRVDLDDEPLN